MPLVHLLVSGNSFCGQEVAGPGSSKGECFKSWSGIFADFQKIIQETIHQAFQGRSLLVSGNSFCGQEVEKIDLKLKRLS